MAASASSGTKKIYEDKADGFLKTLVAWLRTNMLTSFEVVHQGVPKKLVDWLKGHRTGNAAVRQKPRVSDGDHRRHGLRRGG